jgi:hypothetical protein
MRTVSTNLYSINELSDSVKAKVLDKYRYEFSDWYYQDITYDAHESSHMSIDEFNLDHSYIVCEFNTSAEDTAHTVIKNHGESCASYTIASNFLSALSSLESQPENYDSLTAMDFLEEQFLEDMGEYYLNMLKSEYENCSSDEYVTEMLEANGYEFLENGDRYKK